MIPRCMWKPDVPFSEIERQQNSAITVRYLYTVQDGCLDDESYGLRLARIAGFPEEVIEEAEKISTKLKALGEEAKRKSRWANSVQLRRVLSQVTQRLVQIGRTLENLTDEQLQLHLLELRQEAKETGLYVRAKETKCTRGWNELTECNDGDEGGKESDKGGREGDKRGSDGGEGDGDGAEGDGNGDKRNGDDDEGDRDSGDGGRDGTDVGRNGAMQGRNAANDGRDATEEGRDNREKVGDCAKDGRADAKKIKEGAEQDGEVDADCGKKMGAS